MRAFILALAPFLLAGCEQNDALSEAQRNWNPTEPPSAVRTAAEAALGKGVTFLTTAPTESSMSARVVCGIVFLPNEGGQRLFVFENAGQHLRLSPSTEGNDKIVGEGLAWAEYYRPCHD